MRTTTFLLLLAGCLLLSGPAQASTAKWQGTCTLPPGGRTRVMPRSVCFAGQANARVRLAIVSAEGGEPVWMDLGDNEDIYLARVQWLPDGSLSAQLENREQTVLDLVRFDPRNGSRTTWLRETSDVWINLHDMFTPLGQAAHPHEGGFIWASERTGFMWERRVPPLQCC